MKKDNHIIEIFKKHDGELLYVFLKNGSKYKVKNIAWGYDIGDEYAHITSNISPSEDGLSLDFFYTSEILKIEESVTKKILFENKNG